MTSADPRTGRTGSARIQIGLPPYLSDVAAALYLEAFAQKLGPILGRDDQAVAFLASVIRLDHAIVALDDQGALLGLAGFHDKRTGFIGGTFTDLMHIYGFWGALWRAGALSVFERGVKESEFLMDGIAVAPSARGHGLGTLLLAEIKAEAVRQGAVSIRLDVVDTNPDARKLYERRGFKAVRTANYGILTRIFGFAKVTTMELLLGQDGMSDDVI